MPPRRPPTPVVAPTATAADDDALSRFRAAWGRAHQNHEKRCSMYEKFYKAYKGVLDKADNQYENQVNPWYVFMTIELLAANLSDELVGTVRPKTATAPKQGAELLEKILNQHRDEDEFTAKQSAFIKQALIVGVSPAKISWRYETKQRTRGLYSTDVATGAQTFTPEPYETPVCNRPTFTPIRASDFLSDPAAARIDDASYCLYRSYQTLEHLKDMEAVGVYRNIGEVGQSRAPVGSGNAKGDYLNPDTRGTIEVVEYWTCDRLIVVANQSIVIRDEPNPFWHGELPFVVATTLPDLFTVNGISEVETIIDLSRALTRSLNQRLDNADVINNGMVWYDPSNVDRRALEKLVFKPKSLVPRQNAQHWGFVETNAVNIIAAALQSDEQILQQLRDIPGASAYISGAADLGGASQNTATGISLIQTMAQKRLIAKQNQLAIAYKRKARQEIALIQQFTRQADAVRMDAGDATSWKPYTPDDIRGDYDYMIEDAQENLNKQQRKADASNELQTLLGALQIIALPGSGQSFRLNVKPALERYLKALDVENVDEYLVDVPPTILPMLGAQPPLPGPGGSAPSPGAPATGPSPIGAPGPLPPANGRAPVVQ